MLHNRVREIRTALGMTQSGLAEKVGLTLSVIVWLEATPGYQPSFKSAIRLCRYFRVPLGHLFWIDDDADEAEGPDDEAMTTQVATSVVA